MSRISVVLREPAFAASVAYRQLRESRVGVTTRELVNAAQYRSRAPRIHQRIWVDPAACTTALVDGEDLGPFPRAFSGQVKGGDWDLKVRSIRDIEKVAFALRHWCDGLAWEETGAYEHMLRVIEARGRPVDGCLTLDDVIERYAELDRIYERVRSDGRLKTRSELGASMPPRRSDRRSGYVFAGPPRERKGIYVHVGRDLQPIYGGGSSNRIAMAIALQLPRMPALLGRVHRQAVSDWRDVYLGSGRGSA